MRYFGKQEAISLALLLGWALTIVVTTLIFMSMTMPSYATVTPATKQVVKEEGAVQVTQSSPYTDEEIELLALVTMGEAEGESELGKRLVIDTILNRVESDYFPDTIEEVIYQPGQFECMWNGRVDRCDISDEVVELVRQEIESRVSPDVLYFRAGYFHDFGTPVIAEGNHYFSTN